MEEFFRFRQFRVRNVGSALKVGTDAVLLGAAMTVRGGERTLLDIGTGTGVIALMAAQRCPSAQRITGIDIDPRSCSEAGDNFRSSPWASRLEALCVPLQEYVPRQSVDLIFSNPPYYDSSLLSPEDPRRNAARHTLSLSIKDIAEFSAVHLSPLGRLSLILPASVEKELLRTAASFGLYPFRKMYVRTTAAKAPSRLVCEFSTRREAGPDVSELVLQNADGARTEAYRSLTSEFYL